MNNYIKLLLLSIVFCLPILSGCSHVPGAYTLPIEQGNDITDEKISQLNEGMTEEQVRFLLGSPLLKDVFHTQRWDYVYYLKENHKVKQKKHLAVYFEHGRVSSFSQDTMPYEVS